MARHADVVIGSAFGDEGKGLVTDILAARHPGDTLVVRFNGGAQAGHTVVTPQGERHVFSHFGSGAFTGAATFLSRFFVVNPVLFHPEAQRLRQLGLTPRVLIDPHAMVTTPYDMVVNTALERRRGAARHGSCGVGFGETVGRHQDGGPALTVADLAGGAGERLRVIRDEWLPRRLESLGIALPEEEHAGVLSEGVMARFLEDAAALLAMCTLADERALGEAGHVVLEGAQGLLLDQDMGSFPHVTRSNTGLRNAGALLAAAGIGRADVYYVLRPYLTRHGAGPLHGELAGRPYPGVEDQTNLPNPWQGSLRFAHMDLDMLRSTLACDARHAQLPAGLRLSRHLAVTCLDQVAGEVRFIENGAPQVAAPAAFVRRCLRAVSSSHALTSHAATRTGCAEVGAPHPRSGAYGRAGRRGGSGRRAAAGVVRSRPAAAGAQLNRASSQSASSADALTASEAGHAIPEKRPGLLLGHDVGHPDTSSISTAVCATSARR
jgi:adenylosuccinate synthase